VWGLDEGEQDTDELCVQPELHHDLFAYSHHGAGKVKIADLPDEEAEARREERRTLIAHNKAWDAAEPVRREWIATLLTRKTLPKGAALFEAVTLTTYTYEVGNDHHTHTRAFLGLDANGFGRDQIAKAAPTPRPAPVTSCSPRPCQRGRTTPAGSRGAPRTPRIATTCCSCRTGATP